jgi:galactose mutarotase-like enzyme
MYKNQYHHNRNYGCRFREIIENGYRALVIENERLRVSVNLDKGSDIYELLYKPADIDFMWRSPITPDGNRKTPFSGNNPNGSFLDIYEGGWQDILPTIGAPSNYLKMNLGTHGELFSLPFGYRVKIDEPGKVSLLLSTRMSRAPLYVEKNLTIESGNPFIEISQTITNEADESFNFAWGQHPAIGIPFLDEHCVIDVPSAGGAATLDQSLSPNKVIPPGVKFDWPVIQNAAGEKIDVSKIMPPEAKTGFITYLENISEGWYGITNLHKGLGFGLVWDRSVFKHLWMWMVYRGVYGSPWYGRTYNIALEPWSSVPADFEKVLEQGDSLRLGPGESLSTEYTAIVYQTDKRIRGFTEDYQAIT